MPIPREPKIYHIAHIDRLHSIIADAYLWCDAQVVRRSLPGTMIGMNDIKKRRLEELTLASHPGLYVAECVPFYFCARSVMLYLIYQKNHPGLSYHGGQASIIHLEADLRSTVKWATDRGLRWAFTLSNAGSYYFEDRCSLDQLGEIDWDAVQATYWQPQQVKEHKQAEFLLESQFPWELVSRIGVQSQRVYGQVKSIIHSATHQPRIEIKPDWYY